MKKQLLLITLIVLIGNPTSAYAEESGLWGRWSTKAKTTWTEIKTKATQYWQQWTANDRTPSSTEQPMVTETNPAAVQPAINQPVQSATQPAPSNQPFKQIADEVKSTKTHTVAVPARAADVSLPKSKSGVPVFSLESTQVGKNGKKIKVSVKNIPVLNIGSEEQISRADWKLNLPEIESLNVEKIQALDSPSLYSQRVVLDLVKKQFQRALPQAKLEDIRLGLQEGLTLQMVQSIQYQVGQDATVTELPFTPVSDQKLNLLKGLILAEYNKKCHLSVGLLETLPQSMGAEEDQLKSYHYAACIHEMGFFSDSIPALLKIIRSGVPEFATKAIDFLSKDLPREYVRDVGAVFKTTNETWVSEKSKNVFYYTIALSESLKKKYESALEYALRVKSESPKYPEAQYVAIVSEYMLDRIQDSVKRQEKLLSELPKYKVDAPIASLVKMNLGRIAYRNKEYKKAIASYQFIDKDNPLWIQALTEQGWMQILDKDPFGAIGNMHSLHSPYFEVIYKPETYVVRTIGYLNICQYGDAYRSLSYVERFYKSWLSAMQSFKKTSTKELDYYNYVVNYLKSKSKETDGKLPMSVVKEIARQKDFVNHLQAINNAVDQGAQYTFIKDLIRKDQRRVDARIGQVKARINELTLKIEGAKKNAEQQKFVLEWRSNRDFERETLSFLEFEKATYLVSFQDYGVFERHSKVDLQKWSSNLKFKAGDILKDHLSRISKQLATILDNNEFLRYEVYAGSGENIRFVSAGGQTERRLPVTAETKEQKQKWNFDGEFWADEIGHYRSSLKDNCPQSISSNQKVK